MASPDYIVCSTDFKAAYEAEMVDTMFYGVDWATPNSYTTHVTLMGVPIRFDETLANGSIYLWSDTLPFLKEQLTNAFNTAQAFYARESAKATWASYEDTFGMTATEVNMRQEENRLRSGAQWRHELRGNFTILDDLIGDKKMPNSTWMHRYVGTSKLMEEMLGIKPEPLKPGATIRGPDGREYIIAKAAPKPKAPKPAKKDYNTLGVRYLEGGNLDRVYTYRVKKGAKLHLGQEVVVPAKRGERVNNFVAVVVELHKAPQDTGPYEYRYVLGTVKPL